MAQKILLTSGSILAGNPITFTISPSVPQNTPSFHRVVVEVVFDNDGNYDVIKLNEPVTKEGTDVSLDVSSALRAALDSYKYIPEPTTYPFVSWYVHAYDEYMDNNGEIFTNVGKVFYPQEPDETGNTNLRCIAGAFSDMVRLQSGPSKGVISFTRKPNTLPQPVVVGDTFIYTPPYKTEQLLSNSPTLVPPTSVSKEITQEGLQTIGTHQLYALPATEASNRYTIRFINLFGVLESVSLPKAYSRKMALTTESYIVAKQETFNSFSRASVKKQNDQETWNLTTDPLDESWLDWYLHEFAMSEHAWILSHGIWIPCTILLEDETTIQDDTNTNMYALSFKVVIDINGSLLL